MPCEKQGGDRLAQKCADSFPTGRPVRSLFSDSENAIESELQPSASRRHSMPLGNLHMLARRCLCFLGLRHVPKRWLALRSIGAIHRCDYGSLSAGSLTQLLPRMRVPRRQAASTHRRTLRRAGRSPADASHAKYTQNTHRSITSSAPMFNRNFVSSTHRAHDTLQLTGECNCAV